MVFAIGQHHQRFVIIAFLECSRGGLDDLCQRGAALRNDIDVESLDALTECGVINGQRTLQEGRAGKGDEAKAVGLGLLH